MYERNLKTSKCIFKGVEGIKKAVKGARIDNTKPYLHQATREAVRPHVQKWEAGQKGVKMNDTDTLLHTAKLVVCRRSWKKKAFI